MLAAKVGLAPVLPAPVLSALVPFVPLLSAPVPHRSIHKSLPLEGVSARNSNEPFKWSVCFKFFTKFIVMIAHIK